MTSSIRPGAPSDVRALIRMHEQCSQHSISRRYLAPLPVLSGGLAARLLGPPGGFSLITERENELAGIITVAPTPAESLERRPEGLSGMVRYEVGQLVSDRWQRQGLGTALLLAAAREASRRGVGELVLTVHPDNRAVLPMVHSAGLRARVGTCERLTEITLAIGVPAPASRTRPQLLSRGLHSPRSSANNGLALSP
jgi:GNAT superfamily N-acetyltransferase